jgi:hypothetical protein
MFSIHPHFHRFAAALLIGLLAFQGLGWFIAWHTARWEAFFSAQQVLSEENTPVSSVTLPMSLLPALQVGKKEIRYQGRLYDIRSSHLVGDSVRLVLYHDQREEALFNALGSLLSPSRDASSSLPSVLSWLAKWLSTTFVVPDALALRAWAELGQTPLLFSAKSLAAQQEPGILGPPPESDFSAE